MQQFARTLFFNFKKPLGSPAAWRQYQTTLKTEAMDRASLEELNWEKRKALVRHAFRHVPFYREKYRNCGFEPGDLKDFDDFEKLPVLTKSDIRNRTQDLLASGISASHLRKSTTGGSTGTPITVYHDTRYHSVVLGWRMLRWWGLTPIEKEAVIWRIPQHKRKTMTPYRRLRQWPARRIYLDASCITTESLEDFLQAYRKLKPSLLGGYVGGVEFFAQHVLEKELSIPAPKLTWVSSAPVTDVQRQTLRRAFSAPVLDQYGCCEIYWLAAQCPQSRGLHFFLDGRFIEFLDDKNRTVPKTQLGRIALTDLENYAFPLIRYVNEDEGRWLDKTCACGRPFPLIDAVRGRVTERVLLPNGTCLSGDYLTTIFDNFPQSVKQFQLHQQEDYSIRLKVVPNDKHAEAEQEIREVESILREKTQGLAAIEIQKVPRIPHDRGKTRFIISDIE